MSGYLIANYTIHDQEKYDKYPPAVRPTIEQYGGKLLVAERDAKAKGSPHQVLVVIEFESVEAGQRWYESPEYTAIKHYREEASDGWLVFVPSFEMPEG
jgi:uncharacterized protein (DUF1330 family)